MKDLGFYSPSEVLRSKFRLLKIIWDGIFLERVTGIEPA